MINFLIGRSGLNGPRSSGLTELMTAPCHRTGLDALAGAGATIDRVLKAASNGIFILHGLDGWLELSGHRGGSSGAGSTAQATPI